METDWGGRLDTKPENCQGILKGIPTILNILKKYNIKSTFFISGNILYEYREIILRILRQGHEIASHGYNHTDYSKLLKSDLNYELQKSKEVLEEITDKEVKGMRTPQFKTNKHLYNNLKEIGYSYDSSVRYTKHKIQE